MSASTISITPEGGHVTRRLGVGKSLPVQRPDSVPTTVGVISGENPTRIGQRNTGSTRKHKKPRWVSVVRVLAKNLAVIAVLIGFFMITRWMNARGGDTEDFSVVYSGYSDEKFSEISNLVKNSLNAIQIQVNAIEGKLEDGISSVKKDLNEEILKKEGQMNLKFKALEVRNDAFEKFMDDFKTRNPVSKEEFDELFEEFKKDRERRETTLDDILAYARDYVKKELERHEADGLGMMDYALASGGGKVVKHSEPFGRSNVWLVNLKKTSSDADKMIKPSFGEPGQCFPIKGASGFVEIKLRSPIIPEAVTLEHVAKSVAYDRSSAPKKCVVSGWLQGQDMADSEDAATNKFPLTEFAYDLDKSSAQTFKVQTPPGIVDTIRLDVVSNHGSPSHTCIYRLRVHGREPTVSP